MIHGHFFAHRQADPHFNMGFDEWLLARALEEPGYVAVRLYSWSPGAVTFGFNQHQETALDWQRLGSTSAIRRITGGRALYHDPTELTYAVVVNQRGLSGHPLGGSLSETSAAIARALVSFLRDLGLAADYLRQSSSENARPSFFHKAPCFASAAKYELLHESEKLVASAQRRFEGCLLQHGSIKLQGLASHPALPGISGKLHEGAAPISEHEFRRLSDVLRSTVSLQFGMLFGDGKLDDAQNLLCREAVTRVQKNPHGRREIIAHERGANSL